jgi:predicted nucleic acid-binding protein
VEVASSLRRLLLDGSLREDRAKEALRDYLDLPLIRHGHQTLLARVLSLRINFSAYDATYIALAERLEATLVTGDEALTRAVASHLEIETMLM